MHARDTPFLVYTDDLLSLQKKCWFFFFHFAQVMYHLNLKDRIFGLRRSEKTSVMTTPKRPELKFGRSTPDLPVDLPPEYWYPVVKNGNWQIYPISAGRSTPHTDI